MNFIKNAFFAVVLILFALIPNAQCQMYPFIQNPGFSFNDQVSLSADYIYNSGYWWYIMDKPQHHWPSYNSNAPLYLYRGLLSYNRICVDVSYSKKQEMTYYWDNGCRYNVREAKPSPMANFRFCLQQGKHTNFGLSITTIGHLGFLFNKDFQKFSYSLQFEKHLISHIPFDLPGLFIMPYSGGVSLAYSPSAPFGIFNEFKWHKMYFSALRSGFMNMLGFSYRYKFISGSIFYTLIYDGNKTPDSGYSKFPRYDHRIGFRIRLGTKIKP